MPEICSFYGMSIKLVWADHLPKHVHVIAGGKKSRVTFDGELLSGSLEQDKFRVLKEWLQKRQKELDIQWEKAIRKQPMERIEP
jgi:hypothetical protein